MSRVLLSRIAKDYCQVKPQVRTCGVMSYKSQEHIVREVFRSSDAVCFDVDSTVCRDEAIDELAIFANKEKEVMEM